MKKVLYRIYAVLKSYFDQGEGTYPCVESTVEFQAGKYKVRAWINEDSLKSSYNNDELKSLALMSQDLDLKDFVKSLLTYRNINAVHVRNTNDDGVVVYVNWP